MKNIAYRHGCRRHLGRGKDFGISPGTGSLSRIIILTVYLLSIWWMFRYERGRQLLAVPVASSKIGLYIFAAYALLALS